MGGLLTLRLRFSPNTATLKILSNYVHNLHIRFYQIMDEQLNMNLVCYLCFHTPFQVDVFQKQLEFAKSVKRPVSIHCVNAFGRLLEILQYAFCIHCVILSHAIICFFFKLSF